MISKERTQIVYQGSGRSTVSVQGSVIDSQIIPALQSTYQQTSSKGNPWFSMRDSGLDIGGEFFTQKVEREPHFQNVSVGTGGFVHYHYDGPIAPYSLNGLNQPYPAVPTSKEDMAKFGTHAISQTIPTNPLSGMGQALGELKDGLPRLLDIKNWREQAKHFRSLARKGGSEYLNVQFGWLPFVKDIRDFAKVTRNSSQLMDQLDRDSGKRVRRRFYFPDETSTTVLRPGTSYGDPPLHIGMYSSPGQLQITNVKETKKWFSGCYTYYLPSMETKMGVIRRGEAYANKLYGLRLTPDLLWKLAPWSWAADWIGTTGDVIHNWSAFQNDGLVMPYAYVMETVKSTTTYEVPGLAFYDAGPVTAKQSITTIVKNRFVGTPYGFGLKPDVDFSPRQWAIIGALGLSKIPHTG